MNLLETVKQHENKTHKKFHDISMATLMIKTNVQRALLSDTKEEMDEKLKNIFKDAKFIEDIALSVNSGTYEK